MLRSPVRKIEIFLYRRGFTEAPLRRVMLVQLLMTLISLVPALALLWRTNWFLMFFAGAALFTFNFWFMCQFMFRYFSGAYSRELLAGQLARFAARLLLTGLVLAAILLQGESPAAFLAGLSCCMAIIAVLTVLSRLESRRS